MSLRSSYQKLSRPSRKMIRLGLFACASWVGWQLFFYPLLTRQLIDAVNEGRMSDAHRLLRWGANPNQFKKIVFWASENNSQGPWMALDTAAHQGRTDMVRLFLDQGAAVNQRDTYGNTTLIWAMAHKGPSDIIPLLLARGADIHVCNSSGNNLLYIAATYKMGRQMELFCKSGIDINAHVKDDITAIEVAVNNNEVEEARILLEHGADWKHCSSEKSCVWLNATQLGHTAILKLLIEHGADVNAPVHGTTALTAAAINDHLEIVKLLLSKGANPNIKTQDGYTTLDAACALENTPRPKRSYEDLLSFGIPSVLSPKEIAAANRRYDMIEQLVRAGAK